MTLNQNNVQVLERQLQASRDRFRVGEITRTDVAQSEARLAGSVSLRITAEANLATARANYFRVIGQLPGTLEQPPELSGLPVTMDEAWAIASQENFELSLKSKSSMPAVSDTVFCRLMLPIPVSLGRNPALALGTPSSVALNAARGA